MIRRIPQGKLGLRIVLNKFLESCYDVEMSRLIFFFSKLALFFQPLLERCLSQQKKHVVPRSEGLICTQSQYKCLHPLELEGHGVNLRCPDTLETLLN